MKTPKVIVETLRAAETAAALVQVDKDSDKATRVTASEARFQLSQLIALIEPSQSERLRSHENS